MSPAGDPRAGDDVDLAKFGYKQELDRTLGSFATFAAGISYISILTGTFQLFYFGFAFGGPAYWWSWPLVFAGQLMVAGMAAFGRVVAHEQPDGDAQQHGEEPRAALGTRAGERAALVPEELRLEQLARQRGAVDRDEGAP